MLHVVRKRLAVLVITLGNQKFQLQVRLHKTEWNKQGQILRKC